MNQNVYAKRVKARRIRGVTKNTRWKALAISTAISSGLCKTPYGQQSEAGADRNITTRHQHLVLPDTQDRVDTIFSTELPAARN